MKMYRIIKMLAVLLLFATPSYGGSTANFGWCTPDENSTSWFSCMENFFTGVDSEVYNHDQETDYPHQNATPPGNFGSGPTLVTGMQTGEDGSQYVFIKVSWTAPSDTDLDSYTVRIKETSDSKYSYHQVPATETSLTIFPIVPNTSYTVNVRVRDLDGNDSAWSADSSITSASDAVAPSAPTSLVVTGGFGFFVLEWSNPSDADLRGVEIWVSSSNNRSSASQVAETKTDWYHHSKFDANTTRWYWVRSVDIGGLLSAWYPVSSTAGIVGTTAYLNAAQDIQAATIDLVTKITGLLPNANLAQIADSSKLAANIVTAANGALADGSIDSSDLIATDVVVSNHILAGSIVASKIAADQITATHIGTNEIITNSANIGTAIINTVHIENGTITNADIFDGTITGAKIENGTITGADIFDGTITGAKIENGTITGVDISGGSITGTQIENATITDSHLINISADKINAGTITVDGTPGLEVTGSGQIKFSDDTDIRMLVTGDSSKYVTLYKHGTSGNMFWIPIGTSYTPNLFIGYKTAADSTKSFDTINMIFETGGTGFIVSDNGGGTTPFDLFIVQSDKIISLVPMKLQSYASEPTCDSAMEGAMIYRPSNGWPYWCNGTTWQRPTDSQAW